MEIQAEKEFSDSKSSPGEFFSKSDNYRESLSPVERTLFLN